MAHRAVRADVDHLHPGFLQPDAVEQLQIAVGFFAPGLDASFGIRAEGFPHGLRHLRPDLKAAAADARADGRMNVPVS